MNTVLSLILMLLQRSAADEREYILSEYIIAHLREIENITLQKIADDCFMSTNTVLRFCRQLGFRSYSTFRSQLLTTCRIRRIQLEQKISAESGEALLAKMAALAAPFDRDQLNRQIMEAVRLILERGEMTFIGAVFPLALTISFCEDLIILGILVHVRQIHYGGLGGKKHDGPCFVVTFTGRMLENNQVLFGQICSEYPETMLISHERFSYKSYGYIQMPAGAGSDDDDLIFLLLLDLLKYRIASELFQ